MPPKESRAQTAARTRSVRQNTGPKARIAPKAGLQYDNAAKSTLRPANELFVTLAAVYQRQTGFLTTLAYLPSFTLSHAKKPLRHITLPGEVDVAMAAIRARISQGMDMFVASDFENMLMGNIPFVPIPKLLEVADARVVKTYCVMVVRLIGEAMTLFEFALDIQLHKYVVEMMETPLLKMDEAEAIRTLLGYAPTSTALAFAAEHRSVAYVLTGRSAVLAHLVKRFGVFHSDSRVADAILEQADLSNHRAEFMFPTLADAEVFTLSLPGIIGYLYDGSTGISGKTKDDPAYADIHDARFAETWTVHQLYFGTGMFVLNSHLSFGLLQFYRHMPAVALMVIGDLYKHAVVQFPHIGRNADGSTNAAVSGLFLPEERDPELAGEKLALSFLLSHDFYKHRRVDIESATRGFLLSLSQFRRQTEEQPLQPPFLYVLGHNRTSILIKTVPTYKELIPMTLTYQPGTPLHAKAGGFLTVVPEAFPFTQHLINAWIEPDVPTNDEVRLVLEERKPILSDPSWFATPTTTVVDERTYELAFMNDTATDADFAALAFVDSGRAQTAQRGRPVAMTDAAPHQTVKQASLSTDAERLSNALNRGVQERAKTRVTTQEAQRKRTDNLLAENPLQQQQQQLLGARSDSNNDTDNVTNTDRETQQATLSVGATQHPSASAAAVTPQRRSASTATGSSDSSSTQPNPAHFGRRYTTPPNRQPSASTASTHTDEPTRSSSSTTATESESGRPVRRGNRNILQILGLRPPAETGTTSFSASSPIAESLKYASASSSETARTASTASTHTDEPTRSASSTTATKSESVQPGRRSRSRGPVTAPPEETGTTPSSALPPSVESTTRAGSASTAATAAPMANSATTSAAPAESARSEGGPQLASSSKSTAQAPAAGANLRTESRAQKSQGGVAKKAAVPKLTVEELQARLRAALRDKAALSSQLEEATATHKATVEQMNSAGLALQQQLAALEPKVNRVADLEKELAAAKQATEDMRRTAQTYREQKEKLESSTAAPDQTEIIVQYRNEIDKYKAAAEQSQREAAEARRAAEAAIEQKESYRREIASLQEKVKRAADEVEAMMAAEKTRLELEDERRGEIIAQANGTDDANDHDSSPVHEPFAETQIRRNSTAATASYPTAATASRPTAATASRPTAATASRPTAATASHPTAATASHPTAATASQTTLNALYGANLMLALPPVTTAAPSAQNNTTARSTTQPTSAPATHTRYGEGAIGGTFGSDIAWLAGPPFTNTLRGASVLNFHAASEDDPSVPRPPTPRSTVQQGLYAKTPLSEFKTFTVDPAATYQNQRAWLHYTNNQAAGMMPPFTADANVRTEFPQETAGYHELLRHVQEMTPVTMLDRELKARILAQPPQDNIEAMALMNELEEYADHEYNNAQQTSSHLRQPRRNPVQLRRGHYDSRLMFGPNDLFATERQRKNRQALHVTGPGNYNTIMPPERSDSEEDEEDEDEEEEAEEEDEEYYYY